MYSVYVKMIPQIYTHLATTLDLVASKMNKVIGTNSIVI